MTAYPVSILADIGDLLELLIPVVFVIIYAIGGLVKAWLEKKEQQDRQQSLEAIHEAKPEQSPTRPARHEELPTAKPIRREAQSLPYSRPTQDSPKPAAAAAKTRQERLAELQRKRMEYLNRISSQVSSVKSTERLPYAAPAPASPPPRPAAKQAHRRQPEVREAVLPVTKKPTKPVGRAAPINAHPVQNRKHLSPILKDRTQLRTAILLREILDKPIALRDSWV